ncbi:hypothetical protein [Marivirga lumbricoides]|uniref:hypothetical protein n=1 Tax=Marivirga lumbricoides TaxID=1046115 RepID=UPI0016629044
MRERRKTKKRLAGGCNERSVTERVASRQTSFASRPASGARVPDRKAVRNEQRGMAMCGVECRAFVFLLSTKARNGAELHKGWRDFLPLCVGQV